MSKWSTRPTQHDLGVARDTNVVLLGEHRTVSLKISNLCTICVSRKYGLGGEISAYLGQPIWCYLQDGKYWEFKDEYSVRFLAMLRGADPDYWWALVSGTYKEEEFPEFFGVDIEPSAPLLRKLQETAGSMLEDRGFGKDDWQ